MEEVCYPKTLLKRKYNIIKNQIFIIMSFEDEYNNLYDFLNERLREKGYDLVRIDKISTNSVIISEILNYIYTSEYIIADISSSRKNVFYELGIAHVIKNIENVITIKENSTEVPFDIKHIMYFDYNKNNYNGIVNKIIEYLNNNKDKSNLWFCLRDNKIVHYENLDNFVEYFKDVFNTEEIKFIYEAINCENKNSKQLNNDGEQIFYKIEQKIQNEIKKHISKDYISYLFKIINGVISLYSDNNMIIKFIEDFIERKEYSTLRYEMLLSYQTNLVLMLLENKKNTNIAFEWIYKYFKKSKTAKIDLNRYNLEKFLLDTDDREIIEYVINGLTNEDCHIREHMADILGERNEESAHKYLINAFEKETNVYTFRSLIVAIGKIGNKNDAKLIFDKVSLNEKKFLDKEQYFIFANALQALKLLNNKIYIDEFVHKYSETLAENDIL